MGNQGVASTRPLWQRIAIVAVPVIAFAVATPVVVTALTSAVGDRAAPVIAATTTGSLPLTSATVASSPPTAVATTTTLAVTGTTITLPGLAADADDKTRELAAEIVSEAPATSVATLDSTPDAVPAATATATTVASDHDHAHGTAVAEVPLTRQERADLAVQLSQARTAAMKYPTVADAVAAGYTEITGYVPLIGAHYVKWSLMDGTFDVNQPEMLLYDGTDPTSNIVGLSYYMFSDTKPSPFAGPNDHWHQHVGLCLKGGVVIGGEDMPAATCTALGGAKTGVNNGWMVHVWVVPGWESPQGVFSPEHSGLTADLPTS
jgi:hypothetical protein